MRTVTINWETASVQVSGVFTPTGYRVNIGGLMVEVPVSPAVFDIPSNWAAGPYSADVVLIDSNGHPRGPVASIGFSLPDESTIINAPINANAVVVQS